MLKVVFYRATLWRQTEQDTTRYDWVKVVEPCWVWHSSTELKVATVKACITWLSTLCTQSRMADKCHLISNLHHHRIGLRRTFLYILIIIKLNFLCQIIYMRKFRCGRVDPVDNKRLLIWMGFPLLKITLIFFFF